MFGCTLQGSIRLKMLSVDARGTNEILASKHDIAAGQTKAL